MGRKSKNRNNVWLGGCPDAAYPIADFHEALIDVMELADFEFSPVLMDTQI